MVLISANVIIETINRDNISSSTSVTLEPVPSNTNLSMSTFKFGLQVVEVNLSDPTKSYFDVVVSQQT